MNDAKEPATAEGLNLWSVIQWLEAGCDPKWAAQELRLLAAHRLVSQGAGVQVPAAEAYEQGWRMAAHWADRDDLFADIDSPRYLRDRDEALSAAPLPQGVGQSADAVDAMRKARAALIALRDRDMRNTCQHENTHRGGAIWTICDDCGMKWADDRGGFPKWTEPPEWKSADEAIDAIDAALTKDQK